MSKGFLFEIVLGRVHPKSSRADDQPFISRTICCNPPSAPVTLCLRHIALMEAEEADKAEELYVLEEVWKEEGEEVGEEAKE